MLPDKDDL